jgi:hypothetical protein
MDDLAGGAKKWNPSDRDDIIEGMARSLWASAYADYVEELSKQERIDAGTPVSLQGVDWFDDSPSTPEAADKAGLELAALYEAENDVSLDELARRAAEADGVRSVDAESFGHYLAQMAMGSGLSWFDDHKRFDIKKPSIEAHYDGEFFEWSGQCKTSYKNPAAERGQRNPPFVLPVPGQQIRSWDHGFGTVEKICEEGADGSYTAYLKLAQGGKVSVPLTRTEYDLTPRKVLERRTGFSRHEQFVAPAQPERLPRGTPMEFEDTIRVSQRKNPRNPAGLTRKGERMYKHIKAGYAGDPRAKEIASRTVLARAKDVPGLKRLNPYLAPSKYSPSQFDQHALRAGTRVEMEHTTDPKVAQQIAMDHLAEDPAYYTKLATIHNPAHPYIGKKYILGTYAPGSRVQLKEWTFPPPRRSKIVAHRDDPGASRDGGTPMPGEWVTIIRNGADVGHTVTVKIERTGEIVERDALTPLFEVDPLRSSPVHLPKRNPSRSDDEARSMIDELLTKQGSKYGHIYEKEDLDNRTVARDIALEHDLKDILLKMDVQDFLVKNELDYDASVYTQKEWKQRGEKYGNDAPITIVSEGELYAILNDGGGRGAAALAKRFEKFLKSRDLYAEQSYAWAVHLYPI